MYVVLKFITCAHIGCTALWRELPRWLVTLWLHMSLWFRHVLKTLYKIDLTQFCSVVKLFNRLAFLCFNSPHCYIGKMNVSGSVYSWSTEISRYKKEKAAVCFPHTNINDIIVSVILFIICLVW